MRRRRPRPVLVVLPAVVLAATGGFAVLERSSGPSGCDGSQQVRVVAAPDIAPALEDATRSLESEEVAVGDVCVDYLVSATAPEQVAESLATGAREPADLWVPDYSGWVTGSASAGGTRAILSRSLARSPVVVAGPDVRTPESWQQVGTGKVAFLDPLTSSASTAALLSAFGEMSTTGADMAEMGSMLVPLAQRYGAQEDKPETVEEVAEAVERGGLAVMTEQQLASLKKAGKAKGFGAAAPRTGTMVMDYPMVALSPDLSPEELPREAGRHLIDYFEGSAGDELLDEHGFRDARDGPLGEPPDPGLVVKEQDAPKPQLSAVLRQWEVLTVPARSLLVVDVSGSMDVTHGRRSRISLAIAAAKEALELSPDNGRIGLWAFSVGIGKGTSDYRSLVPIRSLGASSRGSSQREALNSALRKLPRMTGGGTGLHDTTLAAVRTVQDGYDARSFNSVILLTDGQNDDPGSLSLKQLVNTVERERDPAHPVQVIAIGLGPDADAEALERITATAGGRSYLARDPDDIAEVFIDAMLSR